MNWLELQRQPPHLDGTPGTLLVPGLPLIYTMERQWVFNERFVSCVPAGEYKLEWHGSRKYPVSWALVGGTVAHNPSHGSDPNRYAILIHPANWARQLNGCIAPGRGHLKLRHREAADEELAVAASRLTVNRIHRVIGSGDGWGLRIIPAP
jgi:hypothetical protein